MATVQQTTPSVPPGPTPLSVQEEPGVEFLCQTEHFERYMRLLLLLGCALVLLGLFVRLGFLGLFCRFLGHSNHLLSLASFTERLWLHVRRKPDRLPVPVLVVLFWLFIVPAEFQGNGFDDF